MYNNISTINNQRNYRFVKVTLQYLPSKLCEMDKYLEMNKFRQIRICYEHLMQTRAY